MAAPSRRRCTGSPRTNGGGDRHGSVLSGARHIMRAIVPAVAARREGDIVNIASTAGLSGYRYFSEYVEAR
ncbi:hypothetical protein ACFYZ8_26715 [Streptomyces sp. NPDC001668]|uniref:hypothetical protein n=1 Tax=unclassified Streptomyces TaxID=2593676 RepID=UPI0036C2D16F